MDLDVDKFDKYIAVKKTQKLWGAPAIAKALGISVSSVYRLASKPDVPIYKPESGGYFAYRGELEAWLKQKPENF